MSSSPADYTSYFVSGQEGQCRTLKPSMVRTAEEMLGYRLPKEYIHLLRVCNGGDLLRRAFRLKNSKDGRERVEYIHSIMGIGKKGGINGRLGSNYLIEEWNYPDVGVVISSDGETAFMLDYSKSGPTGEPQVVLVDVELDEDDPLEVVAADMGSFLSMLYVPTGSDD